MPIKIINWENIILLFFILICTFFYSSNIHLEYIDLDLLHRILDNNSPKGPVEYDPHFNYLYIISYFINIFQYEIYNIEKVFWFFEKIISLFILALISYKFFYNKNLFIIAIFFYLFLRGSQIDQKSFSLIFQLCSLYFYLNKRFLLSSIFLGIVFYFHVGMGMWLFLPTFFSFIYLLYIKENGYNFNSFFYYNFFIIILISPIIYFYLININIGTSLDSEILSEYWIGVNNSFYYFIVNKNYNEIFFILSNFIFFCTSLFLLKDKLHISFNKLISLLVGVTIIFIINDLLVNFTMNPIILKLQLLRSYEILFFLSLIFLSKIIFDQLNKKNPLFFILFIIILVPNPFYSYLKLIGIYKCLYILWYIVLIYELFISILINKNESQNFLFFKLFENINFNKYLFILVIPLLIIATINHKIDIKKYINSKINNEKYINANDYDIFDLVNFVDNLNNKEIIFMIPFNQPDISFKIKKKTLVTINDVYDYLPSKSEFMINFFQNEFNYGSLEISDNKKLESLWSSFNERKFIQFAKKYGVTHIIREKKYPLNFNYIYIDNEYFIYNIMN